MLRSRKLLLLDSTDLAESQQKTQQTDNSASGKVQPTAQISKLSKLAILDQSEVNLTESKDSSQGKSKRDILTDIRVSTKPPDPVHSIQIANRNLTQNTALAQPS